MTDSQCACHIASRCCGTDKAIDALVYELYGLTEEEIRVVEGSDVQQSARSSATKEM